ncbi:MAG: hypothetical protein GF330_03880, partial [Candidatus Eisenbacteria bacterium]|nr:hypothetical protein [Candidatus Eisenbacteria bacterium]
MPSPAEWVDRHAARPIIGVMGAGACDARIAALAEELGGALAREGYVLLCGGGTG